MGDFVPPRLGSCHTKQGIEGTVREARTEAQGDFMSLV